MGHDARHQGGHAHHREVQTKHQAIWIDDAGACCRFDGDGANSWHGGAKEHQAELAASPQPFAGTRKCSAADVRVATLVTISSLKVGMDAEKILHCSQAFSEHAFRATGCQF